MEAKGRARATLTGGCARWVLLTDLRALRTEPATAEHRGQRPGMKRLRGHRSQSVVSTLVAAARRAAVLLAKDAPRLWAHRCAERDDRLACIGVNKPPHIHRPRLVAGRVALCD